MENKSTVPPFTLQELQAMYEFLMRCTMQGAEVKAWSIIMAKLQGMIEEGKAHATPLTPPTPPAE